MSLPSFPQWGRRLSSRDNVGNLRVSSITSQIPAASGWSSPIFSLPGDSLQFCVSSNPILLLFLCFFQVGCMGGSQHLRFVFTLSGSRNLTCDLTLELRGPTPCSSTSLPLAAFTLSACCPRPSHLSKFTCWVLFLSPCTVYFDFCLCL